MRKYELLLVDDDPFILKAIGAALENQGYAVSLANNGQVAVNMIANQAFDLVLTDLVMEPKDGIDVLKAAKARHPDTMVILFTGYGDLTSAIQAIRLDADDYLLKPCEEEEINYRVARCLEKAELNRKIKIYENLLPVCCICKKIRDDQGQEPGTGEWMKIEEYIYRKVRVDVTSTYCPECAVQAEKELIKLFGPKN